MDLLAREARVSKATIYRRWPTKEDAFASILTELSGEIAIPDMGNTRDEIHCAIERLVDFYRRSPAGRAIVALASDLDSYPRIDSIVRSRFVLPWRRALRAVLERGVARGDLRSGMDLDVASDLVVGPIVFRLLLIGGPVTRTYVQTVAEEAYRALAVARREVKDAS